MIIWSVSLSVLGVLAVILGSTYCLDRYVSRHEPEEGLSPDGKTPVEAVDRYVSRHERGGSS
jgi:hypothetical protein